jgi:hypothetical protein
MNLALAPAPDRFEDAEPVTQKDVAHVRPRPL